MTTLRYLEGVILALISLGPIVAAAQLASRRMLPRLTGAPGVLVTAVLAISGVVCVAEFVGTLNVFSRVPLSVSLAVVGVVAWSILRRGSSSVDTIGVPACGDEQVYRVPAGENGVGTRVLAVLAGSVLLAEWTSRTVDALHHGMTTVDTLLYHMPFAARFVQESSITGLHYVEGEPVVTFYPATSELLHAVGIEWMGNDLLSPLMNLGWMALLLLAAWCIGRPFGVAPISFIGAALLLATPGLVATQPGGGLTDVVGLALFLSSVAVLINTEKFDGYLSTGGVAVAALASGLAFGTKFTLVGPVALLTLGVMFVCRPGRRLRQGVLWVGLVALTGGYWYVRNWLAVGNPVPSLAHIGPLRLPSPPVITPTSSVSHYLFDIGIWRHFFIPGFRSSFGPAWLVVMLAPVLGLILVFLARRNPVCRMVAAVGGLSFAVFALTPQYLGLPGAPTFFVYNLRYVTPALLVGLVLLPIVPALARGRARFWLGFGLLAALCGTQLDSTIWPTHLFAGPFAPPTSGIDAAIGLVLGAAALVGGLIWATRLFAVRTEARFQSTPVRRSARVTAALMVVVLMVVVLGFPLQQFYLGHRYKSTGAVTTVAPRIVAWAQGLSFQRVALSGFTLPLQYQYYGRDLNNYVQYLVHVAPNGRVEEYASCPSLLRALHTGRYSYLVTSTPNMQIWLRADPGATLVMTEEKFDMFRLGRQLDLSGCSRGGSTPRP